MHIKKEEEKEGWEGGEGCWGSKLLHWLLEQERGRSPSHTHAHTQAQSEVLGNRAARCSQTSSQASKKKTRRMKSEETGEELTERRAIPAGAQHPAEPSCCFTSVREV